MTTFRPPPDRLVMQLCDRPRLELSVDGCGRRYTTNYLTPGDMVEPVGWCDT